MIQVVAVVGRRVRHCAVGGDEHCGCVGGHHANDHADAGCGPGSSSGHRASGGDDFSAGDHEAGCRSLNGGRCRVGEGEVRFDLVDVAKVHLGDVIDGLSVVAALAV